MTSLDKTSLDNTSLKLWQAIGSALLFLDAVFGVMLLPVLPLLIQELGIENNYVMAAWTGLLVGLYYTGRSGSLAAARACPGAIPANISFLYTSMVLVLSAVTYVVYGQLVGPLGLRWLALFRFLSGILAALHRILGVGCLRLAAPRTDNRSDMTDMGNGDRIPASRGFGATVAGRAVGCCVAGFLFSQGDMRPIGRLCLVWTIAHVPPALFLLVVWRRSTRSGNSREWSALSSRDFGRVSRGSGGVNDRRTEGSEIELVLANGMGNGPDREDGAREGRGVAARPSSPVVAPASRGRPVPQTVESDEIKVPQRYLRGCKGDAVEAKRRWQLTLEWRARERIDGLLHERQPFFDVIKRHYPHYIHRRARNGCPIWIELPTRIDLSALRASGVSDEALQRHYVFVTEYLWGIVEPEFDTGQAVTILDVKGLRMRDLAGEALAFVQRATSIIQDHYVERSNRMFIVNTPSYFSLIWRIIRPMLNERTQAKIAIVSDDEAKIAATLLEVIDAENLPRQYGGSCEVELGESEEERDLREYVERIASSRAPEDDGETEVDLRPQGDIGEAGLEGLPGGGDGFDGKIGDRAGVGGEDGNGIAQRALSSVAGTVEWARGKFQWRRSQIAHLGDENAFVYDDVQQRWVLGGENDNLCRGRRSGTGGTPSPASGGEAKRASRKDRGASLGRNRGDSVGSDTSEEMTVLAIQAAHFSLSGGVTKFSPVPSNTSPVQNSTSEDAIRPVEKTWNRALSGNTSLTDVMAGRSDPSESAGDHLIVYCPCLRPLGRHAAFPALGGLLYTVSSAIREAVPVWAVSEIQAGGLGAAPQNLGVAIAAGVVLSAAGRALTSAGCLGPGLLGHREEMLCAIRGRIVVVIILGMLYLMTRLAPGKVPSAVVWVALTGAVAVTQFALGVSGDEQQKRLGHTCSNGVAGDRSVDGGASRLTWSTPWSGLLGDVFGSAIGPLVLALGLRTGLPSPSDASLWFICCLLVDLLLLVQARHSGELHVQLVDAEEGGVTPGRGGDAHPGMRASELV